MKNIKDGKRVAIIDYGMGNINSVYKTIKLVNILEGLKVPCNIYFSGRGFHLGSSIPMLAEKNIKLSKNDDLYTKKNGEIANYKNIFIIDGTNFTNIPAGSSGLTIMANAYRIATEYGNKFTRS